MASSEETSKQLFEIAENLRSDAEAQGHFGEDALGLRKAIKTTISRIQVVALAANKAEQRKGSPSKLDMQVMCMADEFLFLLMASLATIYQRNHRFDKTPLEGDGYVSTLFARMYNLAKAIEDGYDWISARPKSASLLTIVSCCLTCR